MKRHRWEASVNYFCLVSGTTDTCQQLLYRSSILKHVEPVNRSKASLVQRSGQESNLVEYSLIEKVYQRICYLHTNLTKNQHILYNVLNHNVTCKICARVSKSLGGSFTHKVFLGILLWSKHNYETFGSKNTNNQTKA